MEDEREWDERESRRKEVVGVEADEFRATNDGKGRSTSAVLRTRVWYVEKPAERMQVYLYYGDCN